MVHQIESKQESESYLTFIAPKFFREFESEVLHAYYLYSKHVTYVLIPQQIFEDEEFLECFGAPDYILMESHMIEALGKGTDELTEDEVDEFRMDYDHSCWYRNQDLFYDIEAVLDRHQLFYIGKELNYNPLSSECEPYSYYENSPLQEVW